MASPPTYAFPDPPLKIETVTSTSSGPVMSKDDMNNEESHGTTSPDASTSAAAQSGHTGSPPPRHAVLKTYKLYIGGKFPRTESGRTERFENASGELCANVCRASRKDFREAVEAARSAFGSWSARTAYNRAQILYRAAEMLEGRAAQFREELQHEGASEAEARTEVEAAIDRLVYYAGWADKLQQVFGAVNPVASSHFNFSLLEPTGVVAIAAPTKPGLLGLVGVLAPAIVSGNTTVTLASPDHPLSAISFAEVLASSDVPGGVVNLLTGRRDELLEHFASHMDVNALVLTDTADEETAALRTAAADNLKRVIRREQADWNDAGCESPYWILDTLEVKTTWHPVGT